MHDVTSEHADWPKNIYYEKVMRDCPACCLYTNFRYAQAHSGGPKTAVGYDYVHVHVHVAYRVVMAQPSDCERSDAGPVFGRMLICSRRYGGEFNVDSLERCCSQL